MRNRWTAFSVVLLLAVFVVSGCATARPRRPVATAAAPAVAVQVDPQITQLQTELQAKDQQIQDLQYQLEQSRHTPENNFTASVNGGKSPKIHVKGVTVADLQRALTKAGFDAGSVDGKYGKKTKAALKAFQRAHSLKADGVVGEKTWKLLQS